MNWYLIGRLYHLPKPNATRIVCHWDVALDRATACLPEDRAKADTANKMCTRCMTIAAMWPKDVAQ